MTKKLKEIIGLFMIEIVSLYPIQKGETVDYPGCFQGRINEKTIGLSRDEEKRLTTLMVRDNKEDNLKVYCDDNNDGIVDLVISNRIKNKRNFDGSIQLEYNNYLTQIHKIKKI